MLHGPPSSQEKGNMSLQRNCVLNLILISEFTQDNDISLKLLSWLCFGHKSILKKPMKLSFMITRHTNDLNDNLQLTYNVCKNFYKEMVIQTSALSALQAK